jgi:CheY-like chemotaxis protein
MTGKRILVVEDNEVSREGLAVLLGREGHEVTLACHGMEAFSRLRSGPRPDLILFDMLLPVLDGWQFLARLPREVPGPPGVVIMTGSNLTREWAESHGCHGFVRKPIETEALLEEVRRCLEPLEQGPASFS